MIPRLKARNPRPQGADVRRHDERRPARPRRASRTGSGTPTPPRTTRSGSCRDADGNPLVFKDYPTSRVMDVGNTAYQDAGAARVSGEAKADGFDGVFLDDTNASLRWVIAGGSAACVTYPTTAQWQAAVYSFLTNVAPAASQRRPPRRREHRRIDDHARPLAELERADRRGDGGVVHERRRRPRLDRERPVAGEARARPVVGGEREDRPRPRGDGHPWRGALRPRDDAARRRRRESASRRRRATCNEVWWPEYTTTNALGRPLGRYRVLRNGVYRRDFTHGVVLVNPHAKGATSVRLGGPIRGSGLRQHEERHAASPRAASCW